MAKLQEVSTICTNKSKTILIFINQIFKFRLFQDSKHPWFTKLTPTINSIFTISTIYISNSFY